VTHDKGRGKQHQVRQGGAQPRHERDGSFFDGALLLALGR
jgi:hypothetical protein